VELSAKLTIGDMSWLMDAKVSHKPCPCPSFKILYSTSGTITFTALTESFILDYRKNIRHYFYNLVLFHYVSIISMSNFFYFVESVLNVLLRLLAY
jgi:hypothetical protein